MHRQTDTHAIHTQTYTHADTYTHANTCTQTHTRAGTHAQIQTHIHADICNQLLECNNASWVRVIT